VATRAARRSFRAAIGKPGPTLSPRDESPVGENRWWNAGRRARPQAEGGASRSLLVARPARRLRAGIKTNASAGVPLSFYLRVILSENRNRIFRDHALSRKRVDKRRFVDETASAARADCFVA